MTPRPYDHTDPRPVARPIPQLAGLIVRAAVAEAEAGRNPAPLWVISAQAVVARVAYELDTARLSPYAIADGIHRRLFIEARRLLRAGRFRELACWWSLGPPARDPWETLADRCAASPDALRWLARVAYDPGSEPATPARVAGWARFATQVRQAIQQQRVPTGIQG